MHDTDTKNRYVENILHVLGRATKEDVNHGINWYPVARNTCEKIGSDTEICYKAVAAVIARLSPHNKWKLLG